MLFYTGFATLIVVVIGDNSSRHEEQTRRVSNGLLKPNSTEEFYAIINKAERKLVVVAFSAAWCQPCRALKPKLRVFAAQYPETLFIDADVDECHNAAYDLGVQSTPTVIFVDNRKKVDEIIGNDPEIIRKKIEKLLQRVNRNGTIVQ